MSILTAGQVGRLELLQDGSNSLMLALKNGKIFRLPVVNAAEAATGHIYVSQESDFGECVSDVITLADGHYVLTAQVSTNCTLNIPSGGNVTISSSLLLPSANTSRALIYTGSGTLFTGTPQRLRFKDITISGNGSNTFAGFSGTTAVRSTFRMDDSIITGFDTLGTITDMLTIAWHFLAVSNYNTGFTIKNTTGTPDFIWEGGRLGNETTFTTANDGITFSAAGGDRVGVVTMSDVLIRLNNNQNAMNLPSALTIQEVISLANNNITLGTGAALFNSGGLGKDNIRVQSKGNGDSPDSVAVGSANFRGNATVTTITAATPVKIAGTTSAGALERVTHTTNRLTYVGIETIPARVTAQIRLTFAATLQADTIILYVVTVAFP